MEKHYVFKILGLTDSKYIEFWCPKRLVFEKRAFWGHFHVDLRLSSPEAVGRETRNQLRPA